MAQKRRFEGETSGPKKRRRLMLRFIRREIRRCREQHERTWGILQEKVDLLQETLERVLRNPNHASPSPSSPDRISYKLKFLCSLKKTIYTSSKVEGEDGLAIKVAIFDSNGEQITCGPLASAKFEIVVLYGDFLANDRGNNWSADEFTRNIVKEREEIGSILTGVLTLDLVNGEATLDNITFRDNSSWVRNKRVKLGARILDSNNGARVQEGVTEPFRVKDRHMKASQKLHPPSLDDGIECLEKVGKKRASILRKNGIYYLKDFLQMLNKDESGLREQILGIRSKSDECWKAMVKHAKECDLGVYLYSFMVRDRKILFFNSIYDVVGAKFRDRFIPFTKLSSRRKDLVNEWKNLFYENTEGIQFDFKLVNNQPIPLESTSTLGPSLLQPQPTNHEVPHHDQDQVATVLDAQRAVENFAVQFQEAQVQSSSECNCENADIPIDHTVIENRVTQQGQAASGVCFAQNITEGNTSTSEWDQVSLGRENRMGSCALQYISTNSPISSPGFEAELLEWKLKYCVQPAIQFEIPSNLRHNVKWVKFKAVFSWKRRLSAVRVSLKEKREASITYTFDPSVRKKRLIYANKNYIRSSL